MTLTEFLQARLTEDEAQNALAADRVQRGYWSPNEAHRWRLECEAKRSIVELADRLPLVQMVQVARLLALPYADHPDYQPEWKPCE